MTIYVEAAGCTNACRHCGADGRPPYGRFYSIEELRDLAAEWGPFCVYHEATAHVDFPEVMDPDIFTFDGPVLATNGFGIARAEDPEAVFGRLREFGYTALSCTLHGVEAAHDWFVGRPGAYRDIIAASQRAVEAGFDLWWNIYLDNRNLEDIPELVRMKREELGGDFGISIPSHRVSRRMWRFEALRPSLSEVHERLPDVAELDPGWADRLEGRTEEYWLKKWRREPDSDDFKQFLEPRSWPPNPEEAHVALCFTRDRAVELDPQCAPRIRLGDLSEGKEAILARLAEQQMPSPAAEIGPQNHDLRATDLLHPSGYSVRCKVVSSVLYSTQG